MTIKYWLGFLMIGAGLGGCAAGAPSAPMGLDKRPANPSDTSQTVASEPGEPALSAAAPAAQ